MLRPCENILNSSIILDVKKIPIFYISVKLNQISNKILVRKYRSAEDIHIYHDLSRTAIIIYHEQLN